MKQVSHNLKGIIEYESVANQKLAAASKTPAKKGAKSAGYGGALQTPRNIAEKYFNVDLVALEKKAPPPVIKTVSPEPKWQTPARGGSKAATKKLPQPLPSGPSRSPSPARRN